MVLSFAIPHFGRTRYLLFHFRKVLLQLSNSVPSWMPVRDTSSPPMGCEALHQVMRTTKVAMSAARVNVTAPTIRGRFGAGCSDLLLWRTCAYTRTRFVPLHFSNLLPITFALTVSAPPVKSSTVTPPFLRAAVSPKLGRLANCFVLGQRQHPPRWRLVRRLLRRKQERMPQSWQEIRRPKTPRTPLTDGLDKRCERGRLAVFLTDEVGLYLGAPIMRAETDNVKLPQPVIPDCRIPKLLKGQKALVTGANSGIGKAVAIALAEAGADVVVNYVRDHPSAEDVTRIISGYGVRALAIQADVSQESQVEAMFAGMLKEFGTIDILVNNAGLQKDAPLESMTLAQWNTVIGVNLTGQFLCAREAVREFKRRGVVKEVSVAAGKIICMSSVHETIPWAGHVNYAASKGGVMLMMKSIAQEVAPYRIRVNSICPGAIRTPINTDAWATPDAYNALMTLVPYKRIGEPEDIGRVAAFLASDQADYINGASVFVDGGMTLYPGFATGG